MKRIILTILLATPIVGVTSYVMLGPLSLQNMTAVFLWMGYGWSLAFAVKAWRP